MKQSLLVLGGALVGGVLGYYAFSWIYAQGFYGLIVPGGLLGLGAGIATNRSALVAVLCGLLAVALGLFTEWRFFPFEDDRSFGFFLRHLQDLKPVTLLMIAAGGLIGFWIPFRRIESKLRPRDVE